MDYCINTEEIPITVTGGGHHGEKIKRILNPTTDAAITTQGMHFAIQYYPSGGYTSPNAHPDQEQAYFILSGQMKVKVGGKEYIAKKGYTVFIPQDTEHSYEAVG